MHAKQVSYGRLRSISCDGGGDNRMLSGWNRNIDLKKRHGGVGYGELCNFRHTTCSWGMS